MKKLLVLTPRVPFPFHSGERWILAMLKRLSTRYDVSLFTFIPPDDPMAVAYAMSLERGAVRKVHAVPAPAAGGEGAPSDCPEAVRSFYSTAALAELARVIREDPPDLVHIHFFEMAHFVEAIPRAVPVVMTEHDVSHFWTSRSYLRDHGSSAKALQDEVERRRRHARRLYARCAALTALSRADARELEGIASVKSVDVVSLSVDAGAFAAGGFPAARAEPTDLLFVGNYRHFPNEDAAVHLCRDILPRLRARRPAVTLRLAGAWPTPAVSALAGRGVEVTGIAPRLEPYLRAASVFVAPVRLGAGVKGKILEAFAAGLPVVASPGVAEGFDEPSVREALLVGESPEAFAAAVDGLLDDAAARALLARRGLDAARRFYDDALAVDGFDQIYRRALAPSRAGPAAASPGLAARVLAILESDITRARARLPEAAPEPIRELYLEATHRCDLRCFMCEHWGLETSDPASVGRELTADEIDATLASSRLLGELEQVVVTGGEPWLRADIVRIVAGLSRRFPAARLIVLTNLWNTGLLRRRLGELRELGVSRLHLGSSLDGPAAEHDLVRGREGAFAGLVETAGMLRREFPDAGFGFTFTITPRNYSSLLSAFEFATGTLACDFGAQFVVQTDGIERIDWPEGAFEEIDRQVGEILERLCARPQARRDIEELLAGRARPGNRLWRELVFWSRLRRINIVREDLMGDCLSGRRYAMLDPEGSVFFCPVGRKNVVGSVRDAPFDEIWASPRARLERERISTCQCKAWIRCIAHPIVDRLLSAAGR